MTIVWYQEMYHEAWQIDSDNDPKSTEESLAAFERIHLFVDARKKYKVLSRIRVGP
jgi:hypothetical protein